MSVERLSVGGLKKIAIYGGTFDPVHHAHLILARQAIEALGLNKVILVPAAISPLKTPSDAVYSVSLYYCRDGQGAVCLVDRRRLATRVVPADGGPAAATVHYRPTPPAPGS